MVRMAKMSQMPVAPDSKEYIFTVVFERVTGAQAKLRNGHRNRTPKTGVAGGYQVTVPLLPGLITYGRTLAEAREMARDAIKCHLEGLRLSGERIPDERAALKEKLRVALSA